MAKVSAGLGILEPKIAILLDAEPVGTRWLVCSRLRSFALSPTTVMALPLCFSMIWKVFSGQGIAPGPLQREFEVSMVVGGVFARQVVDDAFDVVSNSCFVSDVMLTWISGRFALAAADIICSGLD